MPSVQQLLLAGIVPLAASIIYSHASFSEGALQFQLPLPSFVLSQLPTSLSRSSMAAATSQQLPVAPHEVAQPAFLYVTAETGELATEQEFNEWYSEEHVPIRAGHIPDFLTNRRYVSADGKAPKYSALYDIQDFILFSQPKYTHLRANRSPREADLVKRLDTLDRRTCKTVFDTGIGSVAAGEAPKFVTTLYVQPAEGQDEAFSHWLQRDFAEGMKRIPGWRRTAQHLVVDSLVIGAKHAPQANTAAKYLIVTEYDKQEVADRIAQSLSTEAAQQAIGATEGGKVEERRWDLYRAWDNTARKPLDRLKPSYPAPGTSEIGDKVRVRRGNRGLTPLDGALLNAPEIANGWNTLLGAVRTKNSLPDDVRELMILRVAARNRAAYEWIHHEHVGRDAGLTTEQLSLLRDLSIEAPPVTSPAPFTALQAAAFAFADASTRFSNVPDRVYSKLREELGKNLPKGITVEQQLVEAAVTTGAYNMVSRFLVATDVAEHSEVMVPFPAVECQTRTLFIDRGVTLNVFIARHKEAKPWLVFVNSLLTDYTMWEGVMARLSKDYNLIAYDQRGHGRSSVPPEPCTVEQLSDDIARVLAQLGISEPVRAVIGISQGGATTLSFAIRHPDKYEKVIVCDTQIKSPEANVKAWNDRIEHAKQHGMTSLAEMTIARWFPPGSQLVKGAQQHYLRPMVENTKFEGFVAGARALQGYDLSGGISEALKGNKKALFVAGEKDGKLPEGLSKLTDQLKGEGRDVSFFAVPNAGHLPVFLHNGLEEFLERVEAFLKE